MNPNSTTSSLPLLNRVAVVTGASSGIGAATARALAARGAKVALLARRKEMLDQHVAAITAAGGRALALAVDVTDQRSVEAAAQAVAAQLGTVSLVVNNAGVMLAAPVLDQRTSEWERMIDLNLMGAMRVIGAFTPALVEAAKTGSAADLINISSIGAQGVFPNFAVYCATKAAVSHLSRNLRTELGPKNVRVSMFEPGLVVTELAHHVGDQGAKEWIFGARQTMEVLQSEDVAETIAFTASLPRHVNLQQVTIMPTTQV
ncbi:MAG: SDR family oxidoreductase [Verrucomicrobia bacterium]|nr:SDR family oxidoreductase [Verrucomicrobiota bacterium]